MLGHAVAALAHIIAGLNAEWDRLDDAGHRIMATFGVIGVDPEMATWSRVPGEARFTLDIRGVDLPALKTMRARLDALIAEAEAKHRVRVALGPDTSPQPGFLNDALLDRLRAAAKARGIAVHEMPSGGGHDALAFHDAGVPTAMLFIRNQNGSHNPDEDMRMEDFAQAAAVLQRWMAEASS